MNEDITFTTLLRNSHQDVRNKIANARMRIGVAIRELREAESDFHYFQGEKLNVEAFLKVYSQPSNNAEGANAESRYQDDIEAAMNRINSYDAKNGGAA